MFWGLIMEPNKRYTQTTERAFHLSMASLDAETASGGFVQVMICYDNRNYLLCTLQKGTNLQVPLDLNFEQGTKIAFTCNGHGYVHLTGYLISDDDDEELDELDDFDEEDEEIPQLVPAKKRKALISPSKNELKKVKMSKVEVEEDEDDDDESDSDNEDELEVEEDSVDLEDEDEDDEDEEDSDEDDEEDEEEETPVKQTKKEKQKQKQQNQQNQQNHQQNQSQQNKKEKNKLVNGKDHPKPEKQQEKQKKKDDSKTEDKPEQQQQQQQKKRTVEGGVQVEDIKVGNGAPAKSGKFVSVYYIGRLKNGKKFDQTQQGEGFKFRLGKGEVIKGWDVGIVGMKVGGKRRISIPPNMAYGAKGSPPVIPPNSQLTFEVELKAIH